jgi:hypothetical protein
MLPKFDWQDKGICSLFTNNQRTQNLFHIVPAVTILALGWAYLIAGLYDLLQLVFKPTSLNESGEAAI